MAASLLFNIIITNSAIGNTMQSHSILASFAPVTSSIAMRSFDFKK